MASYILSAYWQGPAPAFWDRNPSAAAGVAQARGCDQHDGKTFTSVKDFSPKNGFPQFYLVGDTRDFKFIVDGKEYLESNPMEGTTTSVDTWGGEVPYLKVTD